MLMNYLLSKYSCNPIIKENKINALKRQLKKFIEENPNFGFERGFDVMRYVPLAERPSRSNPPPPPPNLINQLRQRRNNLRRRRIISTSYSDSDDSSDLDIVETASPPVNLAMPPPVNITIPPPPPPAPTVIVPRPSQPPPPSSSTSKILIPIHLLLEIKLPRTPVNRNGQRSRINIGTLNNNLQLNVNRPSRSFGLEIS